MFSKHTYSHLHVSFCCWKTSLTRRTSKALTSVTNNLMFNMLINKKCEVVCVKANLHILVNSSGVVVMQRHRPVIMCKAWIHLPLCLCNKHKTNISGFTATLPLVSLCVRMQTTIHFSYFFKIKRVNVLIIRNSPHFSLSQRPIWTQSFVRKGGEKEYVKYFGGETSWKMKEEMGRQHWLECKGIDCNNRRWVETISDCTQ